MHAFPLPELSACVRLPEKRQGFPAPSEAVTGRDEENERAQRSSKPADLSGAAEDPCDSTRA
jgi:hypothetical protein